MIEERISIDLPTPWPGGTFEAELVGPINYLVGPNGSGKSRFAAKLLGSVQGSLAQGAAAWYGPAARDGESWEVRAVFRRQLRCRIQ